MSYWKATRHPAPCFLFVMPLLLAYEYGVMTLGGPRSSAVRNGADAWVRWLLEHVGPGLSLAAPVTLGLVLTWRALRRRSDAPDDAPGILMGMFLESIGLAVALWALSRGFGPLLDSLGVNLATPGPSASGSTPAPIAQAVTFLGAGIYEEAIFRLFLFGGGVRLLQLAMFPRALAVVFSAIISAAAFAAVHHLGERGDAVDGYVFAFRVLAGLIFAGLYTFRGFGIAVGAHSFYDVLVGIPL